MTDYSMEGGNGETSHPMELLLGDDLNLPVSGEIRTGWIVGEHNNVVLVDIGAKSEGIIRSRELESLDDETRSTLSVGSEVVVCVLDPEDENGNVIVSYTRAAEEQDWKNVAKLLESQEICPGRVVGFNRGGLLVKVGELRGFVPNSQLGRDRQMAGQESMERYFQRLVGETMKAKVIEVDRKRNRLILSERAAEQELRQAKRLELLETLSEGDVRPGRVVNLADFGAFVDIGGIEGLVHLSELSWKRVNNPSEVLNLGDDVEVVVLSIDNERQRLALSIKRLQADPWTMLDDRYRVGQMVEATVTKLTKFGAFARISDEYELVGLIHISELSEEHVAHPRDIVKPNEVLLVRIIRIDPEQRQLGLSLKQVSSDKYLESDLEMMATG